MRETVSLDGSEWRIKGHLGLDAALAAAARPRDDGDGWLPATVPGSVINDLWVAGHVADPYHGLNSLQAEWVPERAWTYRRALPSVPPTSDGASVRLRFDGVDHACHVFVDGDLVGRHDGMFRPFEVELGSRLSRRGGAGDVGGPELAVVVEPAPEIEPQTGRTSRVRVHKSRMGYGWDFCPRLVHQGIWQSVTLTTADAARIVDVWARPHLADDFASATVQVRVALEAPHGASVRVAARLAGPSSARASTTVDVGSGASEVGLSFDVERPALWWATGLGEAALHRLDVTLTTAEGRPLDGRTVPLGFRRIELLPNESGPTGARPFTFAVNGRRMYANGWNWVPADALYGATPPDRVEHLLRLAGAANVNLLRVWGGGLIETEAFYDACDRLGILVWQEFVQSSSGIENEPSRDPAFVELMRREAEAIVPLRRNHPSLALWCGGNELADDAGPLDDDRSPVLAALHGVVNRLDPDRLWLPTSPIGPQHFNRLEAIESDPDGLHDVHGPYEHQGLRGQYELYDRGTSLLNGEFGVEGMTNRRTLGALVSEPDRWPPTRANRVYRHLGDWWINEPLVQASFAGRLGDLEAVRRASQLLQADGLRYAIEANRRRWPRHSGSIPWQFNEPYPNAWCTSAVDHRGDPKPAYFAVARAYAQTVVAARFDGAVLERAGRLRFEPWAWTSDAAIRAGTVRWRVVDADAVVAGEGSAGVELSVAASVAVGRPGDIDIRGLGAVVFLDLQLEDADGTTRAVNRYRFAAGSDLGPLLDLRPATVLASVSGNGDGDGDEWSVDVRHVEGPAAIAVRLEDDRPIDSPGWAEIDDGGFDMLPGERRRLSVRWASAPVAGRLLRMSGWNVVDAAVGLAGGPLVAGTTG
ncbi:MAG TPA: glycoside hydrolase family 2 TIM barrel-domain containing protein [Candidatus Limnocylindrales bacterium]|nr:glycoside hydrolase family 2 TIM barrel-domain containing protein [Candidatus Limnocylindrales bacterium]